MEDIDELRRALDAANMRAAAAEAVAGQAEQRVADLEDELERLRKEHFAGRPLPPPSTKPSRMDDGWIAMDEPRAMRARQQELIAEAQRRMRTMDSPSFREAEERMLYQLLTGHQWDAERMEMRPTRMSRLGGRRVSIHYQAESGNIMLRADTGRTTSDSAEYICAQVSRHDRTNKVMSAVVNFVQELDKVKRISKPTRTVDDILRGIERVRTKRGDYTVEIE